MSLSKIHGSALAAIALLAVTAAGCKKNEEPAAARKEPAAEPAPAPAPAPVPPPAAEPAAAAPAGDPAMAAPAGEQLAACTVKKEKLCNELKVRSPEDVASNRKLCKETIEGTLAEGSCPTDKMVGECNSASSGRVVYYKGSDDPKHHCEQMVMGGQYTAAAK